MVMKPKLVRKEPGDTAINEVETARFSRFRRLASILDALCCFSLTSRASETISIKPRPELVVCPGQSSVRQPFLPRGSVRASTLVQTGILEGKTILETVTAELSSSPPATDTTSLGQARLVRPIGILLTPAITPWFTLTL